MHAWLYHAKAKRAWAPRITYMLQKIFQNASNAIDAPVTIARFLGFITNITIKRNTRMATV